jgi:DNA-binding transcriptional LysR family regulator
MELHQIRYFLALTKTLNFTRAAEECNVSQPALSRAISQLEGELGSELFRRERSLTHLTEFGQTILPELRQCYAASLSAKEVARDFLKEGHAPLNIVMSRSIEMDLLSPMFGELAIAFPRIEIKISRGSPHEIGEKLKNGDAEVGISGPLGNDWERLEAKKLYEQHFGLLMNFNHRLYQSNRIEVSDLKEERLLSQPDCTLSEMLVAKLRELGAQNVTKHEVPSMEDLPNLVQANFGIGIWPMTRVPTGNLSAREVSDMDMKRWVHVHTVFGRRLSTGASTFIGLLRTKDWSAIMPSGHHAAELMH